MLIFFESLRLPFLVLTRTLARLVRGDRRKSRGSRNTFDREGLPRRLLYFFLFVLYFPGILDDRPRLRSATLARRPAFLLSRGGLWRLLFRDFAHLLFVTFLSSRRCYHCCRSRNTHLSAACCTSPFPRSTASRPGKESFWIHIDYIGQNTLGVTLKGTTHHPFQKFGQLCTLFFFR